MSLRSPVCIFLVYPCYHLCNLTSGSAARAKRVPLARTSPEYIPTLDGWRCVAISLVVFSHAYGWLGFGTTKLAHFLHYPGIVVHMGRTGPMGVSVFFCISGFLITKRLVEQRTSLKNFYVRRAFRILPAALAYLAFVSMLGVLGALAVSFREVLASLLFYRNYFDERAWYTGHFWSLSIEEQFYLIWPTILVIAGIKRSRVLATVGILGIVVWRQMHWPLPDFVYNHTEMRLDAILCGSVMALAWPVLKPIIEKTSPYVLLAALTAFFVVDRWSGELQGAADFIEAILVCFLMAGTVAKPTLLASRILESSPLAGAGRLSYSIYLWQQLFLLPARQPHWQLPLRLLGALAFAWVSFRFIERPFIAMGRRLLAGGRVKLGDHV
jgi:peptidoglycan/LPS O-acetylase OafA/YrhL